MLVLLLHCSQGNSTPRPQLYREKLAFAIHLLAADHACMLTRFIYLSRCLGYIYFYILIDVQLKFKCGETNDFTAELVSRSCSLNWRNLSGTFIEHEGKHFQKTSITERHAEFNQSEITNCIHGNIVYIELDAKL